MNMADFPDCPEIANALRTGYPGKAPEYAICTDCKEELSGDAPLYLIDGHWICEQCFEGYIDEIILEDLAEKLGIEHKTADEIIERSL